MTHVLTASRIDEVVTRNSPGIYLLGYVDCGKFLVSFVGRAESDLASRLLGWVGVDGGPMRYRSHSKAAYGSTLRGSCSSASPSLESVGQAADSGYTHFEFHYASSSKAAFDSACSAYHRFGGSYGSLDNERHPAPPDGVPWVCPVDRMPGECG